ncbi:c-type cytochrome [Herbaspirillum sp. HC18]|nr:c-type cytochrome [Herbaspirillum sp. HC18]
MTSSRFLTSTRLLSARATSMFACLMLAGLSLPAFAKPIYKTTGEESKPAALYHNYCSVCHGDKGDGRSRAQNSLVPPPRDFTSIAAAQLSRASMIESVANGRPGTAMTAWKTQLTQREIESVVDYVRNTFMPAASSDDTQRGRSIYNKTCSVCHGDRGDGRSRAQFSLTPPPRDFTAPAARQELTRERMIKSVTYGRPETAMAGFKTQLSPQDIEAVVDYIRSGFIASSSTEGISGTSAYKSRTETTAGHKPAAAAVPAPKGQPVNMAAAMPNSLKGDATRGAAFYMSNCSTCHGTTGDGRGPRAYFINPKPRNFLHPASRVELNRVALFKAINEGKLGTEMPAWGKVMSEQEIADVAEFVFQRFIKQSDAGKQAKSK